MIPLFLNTRCTAFKISISGYFKSIQIDFAKNFLDYVPEWADRWVNGIANFGDVIQVDYFFDFQNCFKNLSIEFSEAIGFLAISILWKYLQSGSQWWASPFFR